MKIAYCTVASANYLSRVEVLKKSLEQYNPHADFHILLCEWPEVCRGLSEKTGNRFYSPADIGCKDWLHMAFYYDITEYNTALKPFFLEQLIKDGYEGVLYFDPDIEVFNSLKGLEDMIQRCDVVLTPHICTPYPVDSRTPSMEAIIRGGQFNLGFLGISSSSESVGLLQWWQTVCADRCLFEYDHKYFVDQFWADVFPSLVEKTCILRDHGYNMAYWNVFQRKLEFSDGKWLTDGGELKFFHFSGLSMSDLTQVSIHQNRIRAPKGSHLYNMLLQYSEKLKKQEWSIFGDHPYSFAVYADGRPITKEDRRNFLFLNRIERKMIANPFQEYENIKRIMRIYPDQPPHYISNKWQMLKYRAKKLLGARLYNFIHKFTHKYSTVWKAEGFLAANRFVIKKVTEKARLGIWI